MTYIALFLLIGAIVAVTVAIVQTISSSKNSTHEESLLSRTTLLGAYVLIALAWPISLTVFIYSIIGGIAARQH